MTTVVTGDVVGPSSLVGLVGLEPTTSSLSGMRSDRLSYRPASQPAEYCTGRGGETSEHLEAARLPLRSAQAL